MTSVYSITDSKISSIQMVPEFLLLYTQAISMDRPQMWSYLDKNADKKIPDEEFLNLIINTKALSLLEAWLQGRGKDYSLSTPYQEKAYEISWNLKWFYPIQHPLFDLALESQLVMEQLARDERDELPFVLSTVYPLDKLMEFTYRYALLYYRRVSYYFREQDSLETYLQSAKTLIDNERKTLKEDIAHLEKGTRASRNIPSLAGAAQANNTLLRELKEKLRAMTLLEKRKLKELETYSVKGTSYSEWPRKGEAIFPDIPEHPEYNLFKNRLRSAKQYREFLIWVYSEPDFSNFPEDEKKVMTKLYDYYRK